MRQQGGVRLPAQAGLVASVAQVIQDTSVLSGISGTKAGSLKLGDLAGFGDADVRRKIETRKHDAPQYEDLLVEFYVAAWYLSEGCQVTPLNGTDSRISALTTRITPSPHSSSASD